MTSTVTMMTKAMAVVLKNYSEWLRDVNVSNSAYKNKFYHKIPYTWTDNAVKLDL